MKNTRCFYSLKRIDPIEHSQLKESVALLSGQKEQLAKEISSIRKTFESQIAERDSKVKTLQVNAAKLGEDIIELKNHLLAKDEELKKDLNLREELVL